MYEISSGVNPKKRPHSTYSSLRQSLPPLRRKGGGGKSGIGKVSLASLGRELEGFCFASNRWGSG